MAKLSLMTYIVMAAKQKNRATQTRQSRCARRQ